MALHEFLKTAGAVVAQAREKRVEEVKEHLSKALGGADHKVDGLEVECEDDTVRLKGKCSSEKARETAILLAGNIAGVSRVLSDGLEVVGKTLKGESGKGRFYTIKSGDTLSKIAKEFYGDAGKYMHIVKENKGVIKDPDRIYAGQVIRIPKLEK